MPFTIYRSSKTNSEAAEAILQEYSDFLKQLNQTSLNQTTVAQNLNQLYVIKTKIFMEQCTPNVWPEYFLSNTFVSKYLVKTATQLLPNDKLEILLKKIANPIDMEMSNSDELVTCILKCVYHSDDKLAAIECSNLIELFELTQKVCSESYSQKLIKSLCTFRLSVIAKYIEAYRKHMESTNQTYESLLMEIFMLPLNYDAKENTFYILKRDQLRYFCNENTNQITDFFKINHSLRHKHTFFLWLHLKLFMAILNYHPNT